MSLSSNYQTPSRVQFGKYRFLKDFNGDLFPKLNCCHGVHNSFVFKPSGAQELKTIAQLYTKAFDDGDFSVIEPSKTCKIEVIKLKNYDAKKHNALAQLDHNNIQKLNDVKNNKSIDISNFNCANEFNDLISDQDLLKSLVNQGPKRTVQQRITAYVSSNSDNNSNLSKIYSLDEYTAAHIGLLRKRKSDALLSDDCLAPQTMRVDMTDEALIVLRSVKDMGRLMLTYFIDLYRGRMKKQTLNQAQRFGHLNYPMCNRGYALSNDDAMAFAAHLIHLGYFQIEEICTGRSKYEFIQITEKGQKFVDENDNSKIIVEMSEKKTIQRKRQNEKTTQSVNFEERTQSKAAKVQSLPKPRGLMAREGLLDPGYMSTNF